MRSPSGDDGCVSIVNGNKGVVNPNPLPLHHRVNLVERVALLSGASAASILAPFHRGATANAKRLRGKGN